MFIKNIFRGHEEVRKIDAPKQSINKDKSEFLESLKVSVIEKRKKIKIKTLVCEGDGLGIQTNENIV